MIPSEELVELVYKEAMLLDEKRYDEWLELFTDDSFYWIPAWEDEENIVTDPDIDVSILYLSSKREMETYVKRITSGKAPAYNPHPRTVRMISNIIAEFNKMDNSWKVRYNWTFYIYRNLYKKLETYVGVTEMGIIKDENGKLKIKYKKVNLINDFIENGILLLI
ncbi:MAG: aromatic-ring-hydroxylating dioxygenase subunit beta [Saccharolobus sp.]|uniref:aromatic-ring-hydroxylating dioxygenase subunit beta n=1 Tax=Saccharolobus TaxID=2100760 RepID=UPI001F0F6732|nr:aromatic-ring-hydroxylating dioxygenase subunit beta [Saccharolobus shibatae]MCH4815828.1 aromatic-ring-hydroxylating dioxygenase subunit beta [Saccharolobus shibatae]